VLLLTFRDLVHRKIRFIVVTFLGALVFTLLFIMTGLVEQFRLEPTDTINAIDADWWVVPDGISGPFTSLSAAPARAADAVGAETKSSIVVSRANLVRADGETVDVVLFGHQPDGLGSPATHAGQPASDRAELVADESAGLDVGERVTIGGSNFTVVGTTKRSTMLGGTPMVYLTLPDAQRLAFRSTDVIGAVLIRGDVEAVPDGATLMSAEQVAADALRPLQGAIASIELVRILLWIVAAVIIGAVVYMSALERQRDFAVLKAVGAPDSALLGSLAVQAVLVALAAVALASIMQLFLAPVFPLPVRVPARAYWQLPLLAVAMALLAGAAGMRKVLRSDPSQAFAGAGG